MAEQSGFFPDVNGDREYTSDFLAKWVASFLSNGTYNGELAVTADGSAMNVTVPAGRAWINGYYYRNDGGFTLPIDNADGILNRIDLVVLRWDVNERSITAQVIKGTPASTAAAPRIVRTAEQYDLKLAEISVPAGATAITQNLITDTRLDDTVCGIVHAVVDHLETTTFYNQIAADLAKFRSDNEAGFHTWFDSIKGILGEDEAGNLLNLINGHKADVSNPHHVTAEQAGALPGTTLSCTKSGTVYQLTGLSATAGKVSVLFAVDAVYAAGDTVTIDGTAYKLKTRDGSTLTAGAWAAGSVIPGVADVDNKVLYVSASILKNPASLTISQGYGGSSGTYDGSAARSVSVPIITFHTSEPGTVAAGELWAVY